MRRPRLPACSSSRYVNHIDSSTQAHWSQAIEIYPYSRLQEKAKRNAWQKLVDEKVSAEDAQQRYVKLVNDLKEKYGYNG